MQWQPRGIWVWWEQQDATRSPQHLRGLAFASRLQQQRGFQGFRVDAPGVGSAGSRSLADMVFVVLLLALFSALWLVSSVLVFFRRSSPRVHLWASTTTELLGGSESKKLSVRSIFTIDLLVPPCTSAVQSLVT
eukprot:COSAG02_NODE_5486_length_4288_cov_1.915493_3_plen_134_part_00